MADDAHEERFHQHEDLLARLALLLDAQHTMNQEQAERNRRLDVFIERQDAINAGVQTTLARVETLLARMLRTEDNGRDA